MNIKLLCWHLPIFPGRHQPSIVGTSELNYRVRNGNGWTLTVNNTNYIRDLFDRFLLYHISSLLSRAFPDAYSVRIRKDGTPSGTRTLDTLIKSQVLYQLS